MFATLPPSVPSRKWELTAPESYLLRYGDCDPRPAEVFQLAVKELVFRGALRLEAARVQRRRLPGSSPVWLLTAGPRIDAVAEPVLAPVLQKLRELLAKRSRSAISLTSGVDLEGLPVQDLARKLRRSEFDDYIHRHVEPALQDRGLYSAIRSRTQAGREADAELEEWLSHARRRFLGWTRIREYRGRAFAFAEAAGASVLLVPEAYPALAALAADAVGQGHTDRALAVWAGPQDGGLDWLDVAGLSALDSALGGLAGLNSALGSFDAGMGGGGGGDGGGGGG